MRPCEVYDFDEVGKRFWVRMLSDGKEKEVFRTNLFFVWEKQET
jgi:hypothetical protein